MQKAITVFFSLAAVLFFTACHIAKPSTGTTSDVIKGSKTLYQYKWELAELKGQAIPAGNIKIPYIQFAKGQINKVTGNTGCNNLNGTVTVWGSNAIKFSPLATTRMACMDGKNETSFLEAIGQADNWIIVNNQLSLNSGSKNVAKFNGIIMIK